ncbi:hypothetical protein HK102_003510 [Quaeritorhiza haematococci]|nr:hypothetical protein HK102_003510 [Quaeritorhiza haematococci]
MQMRRLKRTNSLLDDEEIGDKQAASKKRRTSVSSVSSTSTESTINIDKVALPAEGAVAESKREKPWPRQWFKKPLRYALGNPTKKGVKSTADPELEGSEVVKQKPKSE